MQLFDSLLVQHRCHRRSLLKIFLRVELLVDRYSAALDDSTLLVGCSSSAFDDSSLDSSATFLDSASDLTCFTTDAFGDLVRPNVNSLALSIIAADIAAFVDAIAPAIFAVVDITTAAIHFANSPATPVTASVVVPITAPITAAVVIFVMARLPRWQVVLHHIYNSLISPLSREELYLETPGAFNGSSTTVGADL
mmetsp:Transcript_14055/g.42879  ORF Transcript_14055/g.42879 Transcript_14055/m.42879 type:complete len:195 (-) Transcript_14055:1973-2557(-)